MHWGAALTSPVHAVHHLSFTATVSSPREELISLHLQGGELGILKRVLCCFLVMVMPEKGVDETFDWLREATNFYQKQQQQIAGLHTPTLTAIGTVASVAERPALIISE
jgi:hypothetical protein